MGQPKLLGGCCIRAWNMVTSNANKGSFLRKLLSAGKHVVFADDSLRHVKSVNDALQGHAASVSALHYTAATSAAKQNLDAESCDRSLACHVGELFASQNHAVLDLVRKRDAFLRNFIAEQ